MATDDRSLIGTVSRAIFDPGKVTPRGEGSDGRPCGESLYRWQARAVLKAIRPFLAKAAVDGRQIRLSLTLGRWDRIIDALQQCADDVSLGPEGDQEASDLAVMLRNEIDRLVPGTYGGCDD